MKPSRPQKAAAVWAEALAIALQSGDLSEVKARFSANPTPEILVRFRERRLIYHAPFDQRDEVVAALGLAFESAFPGEDAIAFVRYLTFMVRTDQMKRERMQALSQQLSFLPRCSISDLLRIAERSFKFDVREAFSRRQLIDPNLAVSDAELRLQEINGSLVDLASGVARAVNEVARHQPTAVDAPLGRQKFERGVRLFRRAVQIAGEINSLEWLVDSVTFGEFAVAEEFSHEGVAAFRFEFCDERRSVVRSLALRRRLVLRQYGKPTTRYLRDRLLEMQADVLADAVDHYCQKTGTNSQTVEHSRAQEDSVSTLSHVGAEDDLLFAAARFSPAIAAYYTAAMCLRWYALGGQAVARARPGLGHRPEIFHIPLAAIIESLEDGANGAHIRAALERLTLELPVRNHAQLVTRPFIRVSPQEACTFLGGDFGQWPVAIREGLIQGGALGKSVGKIWEDFIAGSFADTPWTIVGRGVKLRENGQTITDADLMLQREDLMLVVQVKALVGVGHTPYDHWKNRQVIELGCHQAKAAADFLMRAPGAIVAQCGRRAAASIKVIQPVVMTNIAHFEGWSHQEVPVIASSTRAAICDGGRVDYVHSESGHVVHTDHLVPPKALSTENILDLIREPLELRIAAGRHGVRHLAQRIGEAWFLIPDVTLHGSPGANEVSASMLQA